MRNSSNAFIAYHARSAELFQSLLVLTVLSWSSHTCRDEGQGSAPAPSVLSWVRLLSLDVLDVHPSWCEAESGGACGVMPRPLTSLETIVAFQNWSQDRWGQVTIWNESTTNPKSVIFIHNILICSVNNIICITVLSNYSSILFWFSTLEDKWTKTKYYKIYLI